MAQRLSTHSKVLRAPYFLDLITQVPFLYQTRSLLAQPPQDWNHRLRTRQRSFTASCTQSIRDHTINKASISKNPSLRSDDHSTEKEPQDATTGPEHEVFRRIFKSITETTSTVNQSIEGDQSDDLVPKTEKYEPLDDIFDGLAHEPQSSKPSEVTRHHPNSYPSSSTSPPGAPEDTTTRPNQNLVRFDSEHPPLSSKESFQQAQQAFEVKRKLFQTGSHNADLQRPDDDASTIRQEVERLKPNDEAVETEWKGYRKKVKTLLVAAKSDIDVWQVLEAEVFSKMERLNTLMQAEEQRKAEQVTRSRRSKKDTKSTLAEPMQSSSAEDARQSVAHVLDLLQSNYAEHCLTAIRIVRQKFPSSPYAPALLARIKSLGSVSYVLGATTALYNELLYISWAHCRDMQATANLVQELNERGPSTDFYTDAIFDDIVRARKKAYQEIKKMKVDDNGQRGLSAELAWWLLSGTREGYSLVKAEIKEARRRMTEEQVRREREAFDMQLEESGDDSHPEVAVAA